MSGWDETMSRGKWLSYHRTLDQATQRAVRLQAEEKTNARRYVVRETPHPDPEYGGLPVWWVVEVSA